MKSPVPSRRDRLRAMLADLKMPGALEAVDGILSEADSGAITAAEPAGSMEACDETRCLTLGTSDASSFLRQRIAKIRTMHGGRTVLLGGPPCQSYSVAGRARNAGNLLYDPSNDERQSLYLEYAKVLRQLQPAVAVMENVRGMLSARHGGRPIFSDVRDSLANAGGKDRYHLYSLALPHAGRSWKDGLSPKDFLVRAEEHGIPQKRHRVFVVCIRRDVASTLRSDLPPALDQSDRTASVHAAGIAQPGAVCEHRSVAGISGTTGADMRTNDGGMASQSRLWAASATSASTMRRV